MTDRWRKPVIPLATEEVSGKAISLDGKRWVGQVNFTVSAEDFERIRLGYVCLNCLEPHPAPFPEKCALCGYAMRAKQMDDLGIEFEGEKHIGPSTTIAEELDRLDDRAEREFWTPHRSIFIPPGVRL